MEHSEGKARNMNDMDITGNASGNGNGPATATGTAGGHRGAGDAAGTDHAPEAAPGTPLTLTTPSGQVWQAARVKALRQGDEPAKRSRTMARRLIDIVNLSDYAVMVRITGHDGRLDMEVAACIDADRLHQGTDDVDGSPDAFAWREDLEYAFEDTIEMDGQPVFPSLPMRIGDAYEMRMSAAPNKPDKPEIISLDPNGPFAPKPRTEEEQAFDSIAQDLSRMPRGFANGMAHTFNVGHDSSPIPLYKRLAHGPETSIVYLLEKAEAEERGAATTVYDPKGSLGESINFPNMPPVRFRMFVTSPTRVDKGVLSELKAITYADFDHLGKAEANRLRLPDSGTLRGCAIPAAAAGAYLRLPVADGGPFPGMATIPAKRDDQPLDPMPAPATDRPIRLGTATAGDGSTVDVKIEPTDLVTHMQVLGAPGSGKTTFLVNLGRELARQGIGFAFFSTHRDLMDRLLGTASTPSNYTLWGIDHSDTKYVVGLNPLKASDDDDFARRVSEVTDVLKDYIDPANQGFFGERAASSFSLVANGWRTLLDHRDRQSMLTIPTVTSTLTRKDLCEQLAQQLRNLDMQLARQMHEQMASMSDSDAGELFSWLGSRFNVLHSSPLLMRILSTNCDFDLAGLMNNPNGGGLVVNLAGEALGTASAQFLMACWLVQIKHAMTHRRYPERPFVVVVDEAHAAAFGPLAAMLDQARKFGVCVVIAHQRMGQLNPQLADALEADSGSFIALRTGLRDAERASSRLGGWRRSDLMRLPTFEAAATLNRAGVPTEPFSLRVDPPREETEAQQMLTLERLDRSWRSISAFTVVPESFVPTPTTIKELITTR